MSSHQSHSTTIIMRCTPRRTLLLIVCLIIFKFAYNVLKSLQAAPDDFDGSELMIAPGMRAGFKPRGCVEEDGECKPFEEARETVPRGGLYAHGNQFYFNGEPFRILSGEFHYFRTHPVLWGDRLLRMKAAGLNTVTTYIPWNLHERYKGKINFAGTYDLGEFIKMAEKVGLKVIIRPGPYICAEWDWGGLPSWLLHERDMKVRSVNPVYLQRVEKYFDKLMPLLAAFSHQRAGPIIAFQVENEYGSYGNDTHYLQFLRKIFDRWGIEELLFTSDGSKPSQLSGGTIPEVLATVNFQKRPEVHLDRLRRFQPSRPIMVGEFWTGWFDHWGESHSTLSVEEMIETTRTILLFNASINFYMFVGGTNFDFYNGANIMDKTEEYQPTITSYDYNAPIAETGDITPKFIAIRNLIQDLKLGHWDIPAIPPNPEKASYGMVEFNETMVIEDVFNCTRELVSLESPVFMEYLPTFGGGGQGYGWILYRYEYDVPKPSNMLKFNAAFKDRAQIFFNNKLLATFESEDSLHDIVLPKQKAHNVLDVLVENMGRCNFRVLDDQRKGLNGKVFIGSEELKGTWVHMPLEFGAEFLKGMHVSQRWKPVDSLHIPALYRGYLEIKDTPKDTFLSVKGWGKGIAIVNDWNLGRYWKVGPQKTLYVPGPLLRRGMNQVIMFEVAEPQMMVRFLAEHIIS